MKALLNLIHFMRDPVEFLQRQQRYTPEVKLHLGPKKFRLIYEPNLAREILLNHEQYRHNRSIYRKLTPLTGRKGLVQLEGKMSRQMRSLSLGLLTPENREKYAKIIEARTLQLIEKLKTKPENLKEAITTLVLSNAFEMFLGSRLLDHGLVKDYEKLNQLCGQRMLSPIEVNPLKTLRLFFLARKLRGTIKRHRQTASHTTICDLFEDESAIDQCLTFLFAGHETTAASLVFTLELLARHPEYQEKLHQSPTLSRAIYQESLRLYPPAYMLVRECQKTGEQIIIATREIFRSPVSFHDPQKFQPERFLHAIPKAFFPFGLGAKSCIGESLAYLEADIILRLFCQHFHLTTAEDQIGARPMITLHPLNSRINLCQRQPPVIQPAVINA